MPITGNTKPFLNIEDQIALLKKRGLNISNVRYATETLRYINYYRLSAYSLTLRKNDIFYPHSTFEQIMELYNFDAAFRNTILRYTAYIENAFRTYIAYHHTEKYGPLGYLNNRNFENEIHHSQFILKLFKDINYSNAEFIKHHKQDLNNIYPFWVAIEVISFNVLSKLYKNLLAEDKTYIAKTYYGVHRKYVENWLQMSVISRNISAHGDRFYNRKMGIPIKLDSNAKKKFDERSAFAAVYAIFMLLPHDSLRSSFIIDIEHAFEKHPFAEKQRWMGFPNNWKEFLETSRNK